jgi:cytochrome P450
VGSMAGGELGRIAQRGDCLLDELDPIDRPKPERPTDPWHWRVNPRVHELFAELAKHEAERREQDREMLATLFAERREQKQWCAGEA